LPSEIKYNLSLVAAVCVYSVESANDVGTGEEGIDISGIGRGYAISFTQRNVNILSQILCLKLFLLYYLFSLLFAVPNI